MMRLLILCLLIIGGSLHGQIAEPTDLNSWESRNDWLKTVFDAHQEYRNQSSDVLLEFGYDSAEHRELQRNMSDRDSTLRIVVDKYLDRYGYPVVSTEIQEQWEDLNKEMARRMKLLPKRDSLSLDSLFREIRASQTPDLVMRDYKNTIYVVLDTEPDFQRRCETISMLRHEYETENLSLVSMLSFLRHTYRIRYGREMDIPTGTTERERLMMYGRELSGCWSNP